MFKRLFDFSGFLGAIKRHWLLFALTILVVVVFFGGVVVSLWNKLRVATKGALPASKVAPTA